MLFNPREIVKETEKAVAVLSEVYAEAKKTAAYDLKELNGEQIAALKNGSPYIWLPKSQVVIEDGCVVDMPEWLASKNGFATVESVKKAQERRVASEERYNNLVKFAKDNGLAVKNKMKAVTILNIIKDAGLTYNY